VTPDSYDSSERRSVWLKDKNWKSLRDTLCSFQETDEDNLLVGLLVVVDLVVPEDGLITAVLATFFLLVSIRSGMGSKLTLSPSPQK
jgi:hypothetical protein